MTSQECPDKAMEEKNLLPHEALREARKQAGISQYQLAAKLGVLRSFVANIEQGNRIMPRSHYAKLPEPIKSAVVEAEINRLWRKIVELRHEHKTEN